MITSTKPARLALALALLYLLIAASRSSPCEPIKNQPRYRYTVSLAKMREHLVSVKIDFPAGAGERLLQLPAWYALYQIRNFAQYVNRVRAASGGSPTIHQVGKDKWRIAGAQAGASIEYEVFANDPGPFGAQLNSHHAFFNLAEILMYPVEEQNSPLQISFTDLPDAWRVGTTLLPSGSNFIARNYDQLADTPVEIGNFEEKDFDEGGGHYRIIIDRSQGDYDMRKFLAMLRRIVSSEINWMSDRPFETYLFIYHFQEGSGGGGMEHADSTAIDMDSRTSAASPHALESVSAHEFFHLWNVKRIRPQSLEPPDYAKENYSDALWFSEGVTSTVEDYTLLWAGLIDQREYLSRLAAAIGELENRPAHLTQSAEESSLDAWLEEYPYYRTPARSISYYNKGSLLGVILDLQIRKDSGGTKSLRDLFQWMNVNYSEKSKPFEDSEGIRHAAETVGGSDLRSFFQKYVAGTEQIPWNAFLNTVGLRLVSEDTEMADLGFSASRNFGSPLAVIQLKEDGAAENAGLRVGDVILRINGKPPDPDFQKTAASLHAQDRIRVHIRNQNGVRELSWKLDRRKMRNFRIEDLDDPTEQQKAQRAAWLKGESQTSAITLP